MDNVIDIQVRADGVYLIIDHPADSPSVSRMEVMTLIESYGVSDVDYVLLNEELKKEYSHLELKISSNTRVIQVDESASLEVSKDRMEVYITFSEPVNKGRMLTPRDIIALFDKEKLVRPDPEKVEALLKNKRYARQYTLTNGKPPVKGIDGYLKYHFDNSNLRPKPKIMEDGTVNYRDLGMIRQCARGDILVTSVPPEAGTDGVDVYGKPIPHTKGRMPIPLPRGKGTVISQDGKQLISDAFGQLVILNGRIEISPILDINGDVGNSTGNIDFNGTVTVRGNVLTGFVVKATGNIEVMGVCEGATLISSASILLAKGAQGADRAELIADGDITAKFIESCKVTAGGNISADSILKCVVNCSGSVVLTGRNGLLVGGSVLAGSTITAKTIGSPMGTQTEVQVGNHPQDLLKLKTLSADMEPLKKDLQKCEMAINTLNAMKQKEPLSEDKQQILLKMISARMALLAKIEKMKAEIAALTQRLSANTGSVSVERTLRPGVKVTIGNASLLISDEIPYCTLRNIESKISVGPYA